MLKNEIQDEGLEGWIVNFRPVPWKSDPWKARWWLLRSLSNITLKMQALRVKETIKQQQQQIKQQGRRVKMARYFEGESGKAIQNQSRFRI